MSQNSTDRNSPTAPRLVKALERQLARRDELLRGGARQVGWKLGIGERESIGAEIAVGFLTSATALEPGAAFGAGQTTVLHADAEVAVEFAADVDPGADNDAVVAAIRGFRPALEIVDIAWGQNAEEVIAGNVFHRAVALGELQSRLPNEVEARLVINGETGDVAPAPEGTQLVRRLAAAARILTAAGERMRAGEVVITGNVVQVPVAPGDEVVADFDHLGSVALRIMP